MRFDGSNKCDFENIFAPLCNLSEKANKMHTFAWGAFNNYVDQILTHFDHLPPSGGQLWTFYTIPTL